MRSIIVNESQLAKLVKKLQNAKLNEGKDMGNERYMFFSNLEQMQRQCELLLDLDEEMIESILSNGHDWAQDHIAEAKNNLDQVFDFLMNETERDGTESSMDIEDDMVQEGEMDDNDFTVEPQVKKIPREYELSTVFGKYGEEVPNDVLRYMRKNPKGILEKLYILYGDSLYDRLNKIKEKMKK